MKFLVDAHLPPGLCALLLAAGHDAIHTRQGTTKQLRVLEKRRGASLPAAVQDAGAKENGLRASESQQHNRLACNGI